MNLNETMDLKPTAAAARAFMELPFKAIKAPRLNRMNMPATRLKEVLTQARQTLSLYEQVCKPSAAAMRFLIEQLEKATRVTLEVPLVPQGTEMSMLATLQQHGRGLAHPIERSLLVEYDHGGVYDAKAGLTHALSTRRIALVVPMETEFAVTTEGMKDHQHDPDDRGALLIWSINYFEEKKEWEFAPSAAILSRRQAFEHEPSHANLWKRLGMGWGAPEEARSGEEGGALGDPITVRFQDMLPELLRQLQADEISRIAREVSMDACWAALGVLTAFSTTNVGFDSDDRAQPGAASSKEPAPLSARVGDHWVPLNPFQGRLACDKLGRWVWSQGHVGLLG
jgi:hypothetical protein